MYHLFINSLPNDKILGQTKLKAFSDKKKTNMAEKLKFVLGTVENIVGKGENAGYQHFLLFPQCFQKASFTGSLNFGIVWQRVKPQNFGLVKWTAFAEDKFNVDSKTDIDLSLKAMKI